MLWEKKRKKKRKEEPFPSVPCHRHFLPFLLHLFSLSVFLLFPLFLLQPTPRLVAPSLRDLPHPRPTPLRSSSNHPDLLFFNLTVLVKDSKKIEKRFARPAVKKVQALRGGIEEEKEEARGKVTKNTEV